MPCACLKRSVDSDRDRRGCVGQELIIDQADHDPGDQNIKDRTDRKRAQNADRHITLRILCFLGRGRNGVKSDVGKEDDRRPGNNTAKAIRHEFRTAGSSDGAADADIVWC